MVDFLNNILWSYVLIVGLIGVGIYFSVKTKFAQFRMIKEMIRLLTEGATKGVKGNKEEKGITSFQAFCISTASRVGTGNMAGVALAIAAGGPGAVFWMWMLALIGSASAFVESTLAQLYKVKDGDAFRGGPAYYMEKALKNRKLGIAFSILITVCFGLIFNSVQSNTIAMAFNGSFGISKTVIAVTLAVFTAIIIFGGVKRIASFVEKVVPVMAICYVVVATVVIIMNITQVPAVFGMIIEGAFNFKSAAGGALGAALMQGIKRGLFSNEAGMGSAPNAAATATVSHPVKQGLIQALGVFTDTILICSATAFIILLSGYQSLSGDGIQMTQSALSMHIGNFGGVFIAVCIFLFAFSSVIGNYYYGEANIEFMTDNRLWLQGYRAAVVMMVLLGGIAGLKVVWGLADLFMGLMAILNLYAILKLGPVAFRLLEDYSAQRKQGLDPILRAETVADLDGVECWTGSKTALKKVEKKLKTV
ncbi:MAG: alanine/glycine:cation symporter family protein [Psychrilyobacter sp.]|uniref:alanine/glycine:cation symporter family protein n=1 Tax=Psychrilyobacter sp. TaxID=2586924 RepID=UPI003C726E33